MCPIDENCRSFQTNTYYNNLRYIKFGVCRHLSVIKTTFFDLDTESRQKNVSI